jgi:hypothetical protein
VPVIALPIGKETKLTAESQRFWSGSLISQTPREKTGSPSLPREWAHAYLVSAPGGRGGSGIRREPRWPVKYDQSHWRFVPPRTQANSDPRRLYHADASLKQIAEMDDDTRAAIASMEVHERKIDGIVVRTVKIKFWDKNAALEKAMRHLGLYERDNASHSENLELQVVLVGKP